MKTVAPARPGRIRRFLCDFAIVTVLFLMIAEATSFLKIVKFLSALPFV